MKVAFFSNYLNSHWIDFCDELFECLGTNFVFYSRYLSKEKKDSRGSKNPIIRNYVKYISGFNLTKEIKNVVDSYDVIIVGANNEDVYKVRLKKHKLVIRVAERSIKRSDTHLKNVIRKLKYFFLVGKQKNEYLFSLSSYCVNDYRFTNAYKNRIFDFGYFPTFRELDSMSIIKKKDLSFLWVGRFISWKHPEIAVGVIKKLVELGLNPVLTMCGDGEMYDSVIKLIKNEKLNKNVFLLGKRSQDEVRQIMLENKYFLFTSDSQEGWGAVLNESMNEGCIPFASKLAGSTNQLIKNEWNGFITDNTVDDIVEKIIKSRELDEVKISQNAYLTIKDEWNGKNAAHKLLAMVEHYLQSGKMIPFNNGVLKKSEVLI